jgi:hypothetical protein
MILFTWPFYLRGPFSDQKKNAETALSQKTYRIGEAATKLKL